LEIKNLKLTIFIIIAVCLAFAIGYTTGSVATMSQCVKIGVKVLEDSGFEISPTIINDIIMRYGGSYLNN